jgi:hypothetical protein
MRLFRASAAVLGLFLSIASVAVADEAEPGPDLAAIRAEQTALRVDVEAGKGVFGKMANVERQELAGRQAQLLALIDGVGSIKELDDDAQVRAFNLLQQINATVTQAEDSQIVCEYTKKTGSHRKVKECMTVAERRRDREESQKYLEEFRKGFCIKNGQAC